MTQKNGKSAMEKDRLLSELYVLFSEGINKDGEGKNNLLGSDALYVEDASCERTGLYY